MMSFARRNSSRGMTLIEILIGLSIAALLLVAVASALITALRSVGVNEQHVRSRQSAGAALNYMLARIRTAKELTLSPTDADDPANDTWTTGAPQLEVSLRDWNTSPQINERQFKFEVPEGARRRETMPAGDIDDVASAQEGR